MKHISDITRTYYTAIIKKISKILNGGGVSGNLRAEPLAAGSKGIWERSL